MLGRRGLRSLIERGGLLVTLLALPIAMAARRLRDLGPQLGLPLLALPSGADTSQDAFCYEHCHVAPVLLTQPCLVLCW